MTILSQMQVEQAEPVTNAKTTAAPVVAPIQQIEHMSRLPTHFRIVAQIANGGGLEALALDTAGRLMNRSYGERVALHEAGHFLVAYLLGWLPRAYTLSSLDAFRT